MSIRLLLDEDVPILLAHVLRERGHDVVHATEEGLSAASDDRVFAQALDQGRVLLTHNVADFLTLTQRFASDSRPHGGLFLVPQLPFGKLLRRAGLRRGAHRLTMRLSPRGGHVSGSVP